MMSCNTSSELAQLIGSLVGALCWGVNASSATGSRFNLDLGERLHRPSDLSQGNVPIAPPDFGEFGIQVGCAAWRLEDPKGVITGWTDASAPDGPMYAGLRGLQGSILTAAEITLPGVDLLLEFDEQYVLRVFCDQFEDPYENYSISFRDTYYIVKARAIVVRQAGADPAM